MSVILHNKLPQKLEASNNHFLMLVDSGLGIWTGHWGVASHALSYLEFQQGVLIGWGLESSGISSLTSLTSVLTLDWTYLGLFTWPGAPTQCGSIRVVRIQNRVSQQKSEAVNTFPDPALASFPLQPFGYKRVTRPPTFKGKGCRLCFSMDRESENFWTGLK